MFVWSVGLQNHHINHEQFLWELLLPMCVFINPSSSFSLSFSQKNAVWHSRGRRQLQPPARGAPGRVRLGRGTAPWRLNIPPDQVTSKDIPPERWRGQTWSLLLTCLFSSGWRMPNNQKWFGDNRLLSVYMGLNHPQKLFLMPDRCSKTIWENTSSGWNFGRWAFGFEWCLSSSQKKNIDIQQLSYERVKNDSSKILSKWIYSDGKCIFFSISLF